MLAKRKLVAIVITDVVGYSRLMEHDESGTHARLRELREGLIEPQLAAHAGRLVKTIGDGMLLEFPSATSALRWAIEVQRAIAARNEPIARDQRIELRIGINLGDVIIEGDDIIGDGVNVATRLEPLAEPGGICVASAILEQLHENLGVEFVDMGEQRVKNIRKPVHVFRVALACGASGPASPDVGGMVVTAGRVEGGPLRIRRTAIISIGVLALGVAAVAAWIVAVSTDPSAMASFRGGATAPPSRSIMVMPFDAPHADAELRALADSLTAEMTRSLANIERSAAVITPDAASVADAGGDRRAAARKANVHYLIEGDVRTVGEEVVVTTRLIDAPLAKDLGGVRRAVARAGVATDYERLAQRLTYATRAVFRGVETRRASRPPSPGASAQDLVDRALFIKARGPDPEMFRDARKLLDEAIRRDPSLGSAWVARAELAVAERGSNFVADNARPIADMERDSLRAVTLDGQDPYAWNVRGWALLAQLRFDSALAASDRQQQIDPTGGFYLRATILDARGRADETLKLIASRDAMLDRSDPILLMMTCEAHLFLGEYRQAIADCERAATGVDEPNVYFNLAAAYAQVGDIAKAARARDELMRWTPTLTIGRYMGKPFSNEPAWLEQQRLYVIPGLRKAGVPE